MNFNYFLGITMLLSFCANTSHGLPQEARDNGFVYLHEIDPSIITSVRYYGNENFLGTRVDGYNAPVIVITRETAQALKEVQTALHNDGYSLVVYDGYRPQRAVDHFVRWSEDPNDAVKKSQYYPRINKADVFDLGYVAKRSGHSRGSTVDLTIIRKDKKIHDIQVKDRVLSDGFVIKFLDDGTEDMGSSFDLCDEASHIVNNFITSEQQQRRIYLNTIMKKHGFNDYKEEWWHFTLKNERFHAHCDSSYFDFSIEI